MFCSGDIRCIVNCIMLLVKMKMKNITEYRGTKSTALLCADAAIIFAQANHAHSKQMSVVFLDNREQLKCEEVFEFICNEAVCDMFR